MKLKNVFLICVSSLLVSSVCCAAPQDSVMTTSTHLVGGDNNSDFAIVGNDQTTATHKITAATKAMHHAKSIGANAQTTKHTATKAAHKQTASKSAQYHLASISDKDLDKLVIHFKNHKVALNKKLSKQKLTVAVTKARKSLERLADAMTSSVGKARSRQETKIASARVGSSTHIAMRQDKRVEMAQVAMRQDAADAITAKS